MGIGIIFSVIIGIIMTVTAGTQVLPSYIEKTKIAKVENRTIANQNTIKEAIIRYIEVKNKLPKTIEQLQEIKYLNDYHLDNLFGGEYEFSVDVDEAKQQVTLKISTTINDTNATKYFSNSFKFPNPPICTQSGLNHICETFYLLDKDTFKSIPIP